MQIQVMKFINTVSSCCMQRALAIQHVFTEKHSFANTSESDSPKVYTKEYLFLKHIISNVFFY